MSTVLVVLSRGVSITKAQWREPGFRRTLEALSPHPLTQSLARSAPLDVPWIISAEVEGSAIIQQVSEPLKQHHGIFEVRPTGDAHIRLILREEECSRLYRTPRRRTQTITTLEPWHTARILINGRVNYYSYSTQFYLIHEYYWTLCSSLAPAQLPPVRTFDLQADLS